MSVAIFDNANRYDNVMTASVAHLYKNKNHSTNSSLFTSKFFTSPYVDDIQSANVQIIEKLNLSTFSDYIVIGKYTKLFENGTYTKYICRASLNVSIISCSDKSLLNSFTIAVSNGFDDQQHAEEGAKEKILDAYKEKYLNL